MTKVESLFWKCCVVPVICSKSPKSMTLHQTADVLTVKHYCNYFHTVSIQCPIHSAQMRKPNNIVPKQTVINAGGYTKLL